MRAAGLFNDRQPLSYADMKALVARGNYDVKLSQMANIAAEFEAFDKLTVRPTRWRRRRCRRSPFRAGNLVNPPAVRGTHERHRLTDGQTIGQLRRATSARLSVPVMSLTFEMRDAPMQNA